jgi:hypothetical protein
LCYAEEVEITKYYPSEEVARKAYGLFLAGHQITDISYILDLPVKTLRKLVFGEGEDGSSEIPEHLPRISGRKCWAAIREELDGGVITSYVTDKKMVLEKVNGTAVECVVHGLENILSKLRSQQGSPLSVKDVKTLSELVANFDRIVRLESGQATDITKVGGLSPEELRKIIDDDPFSKRDIIDADFRQRNVDESTPEVKDPVLTEKK